MLRVSFANGVTAWCRPRVLNRPNLIFGLARQILTLQGLERRWFASFFNHLLDIECAYEADRSDIIWLPEHLESLLASANEGMQIALILALNLGHRGKDRDRLRSGATIAAMS